jgi:hypothetical protein
LTQFYNRPRERPPETGTTITAVENKGWRMHPQEMIGYALAVVVPAFTIASAWQIANQLWLDYTRVKRALPFFGKRWAQKSGRRPGKTDR